MKRSRMALLLFMATFAGSLLAAGMAGGEGGVAAQQFAGGSTTGGYCEFAYDPIDEEPYDSCDLGSCEFAGPQSGSSLAGPQTPPWFDDDSLDYYDADSIGPARPYQPPKVSASLNEPIYGVPAEDELPSDSSGDEVAYPDIESESRVDAPSAPADQVLWDPLTRTPCNLGSCTRYCWPELYGDTDPDADPYIAPNDAEPVNPVSELIADLQLVLDDLLGTQRTASQADFVRRIETPSDFADASSGSWVGGGFDEPPTPEFEALVVWGRQLKDWLAQQDWLAQELATLNSRAEFYVQGLTPPPAHTPRITIEWSKVDPAGRTQRFLLNLWTGYCDAARGLSQGVSQIATLPGLFDKPVRQAQDPTVRTRTSLRTPWRIDL